MPLTFFGHFAGHSSYPVVCRAVATWLEQHFELERVDLRTGTLPACHRGPALLFGFPTHVEDVAPDFERLVGYHVCDVDRIPDTWVEVMNREAHVLTPSAWCAFVFTRCGVTTPISIVPHGIDPDLFYLPPRGYPRHHAFTFRHFTSSYGARKGTKELVRAFLAAFHPHDHVLLIIHGSVDAVFGDPRLFVSHEGVLPASRQAERYWASDVVVLPSRAEGFGMCGLESLACGTPILATNCTGHQAWFEEGYGNMLEIATGGYGPCHPGDGLAPLIDEADLESKLRMAWHESSRLKYAARKESARIRAQHSWSAQLTASPLLDVVKGIM